MATQTEIANIALTHIGVGKEIGNLETEKSEEAEACRRMFDLALDETLRGFAWPFATRFVTLALVADNPTTEWAKSYRYPSDCLLLRRLLSGARTDTRQSRVPYRVSGDAQGKLILTDISDAVLEYTVRVTNTETLSPDFTNAIAALLAFYIAPRLTGGDPFKLGQRAYEIWRLAIANAAAMSVNEEQPDEEPDSEFVRTR